MNTLLAPIRQHPVVTFFILAYSLWCVVAVIVVVVAGPNLAGRPAAPAAEAA